MNRGITITAVWRDIYMIEVLVEARSEYFAGAVRAYTTRDELESVVTSLAGFPQARDDSREITLGEYSLELGGASKWPVRLRFYTTGGHVRSYVQAQLEEGLNAKSADTPEAATIIIPVEAAGIDAFLRQLQHLAATEAGTAYLPAAT